jgi:hypothetical protein
VLRTYEEMCDEESICNYCSQTDYGECKSSATPNGYWSCEGSWCKDSYDKYLDDEGVTENIVKYASKVKLLNKEDFSE